jgi:hypothetical protein
MNERAEKKIYIPFDPSVGYPFGDDLFYECLKCGTSIPSLPEDWVECACRNIQIDAGFGRVAVKDHQLMKIFRLART